MNDQTGRPRISRDRVLDAALELVARSGIAGLSMRKLGVELGVEAMTLYYYFPNKDAILDGLVERVTLSAISIPPGPPETWTKWLRELAISFHRELLRHPRLVSLIATRPVMTPDSLRAVEQLVAVLCAAGFSPLRAFQILNTITTFVVGHTLAEAGDTPGHESSVPDTAGLADQLSPADFPCWSAALHDGLGQPHEHQSRFDFALDALLTGLTIKASQEHGPTPYRDVNAILHLLTARMHALLGPQLVSLYLYGSLSLGDFDPASSDIDFLAVTDGELPEEMLEALRAMHMDITNSGLPYANHLEGSYIPREALRRYDPANARHPTIGVDWPFHVGEHGPNWIIERHIVREHGVILYGPAPQTLIDPVSPQELRTAVRDQLKSRWQSSLLADPEWLRPRNYQAFAVLTFCRALYTLHHGTVCSKPQAAAWAQATYPQWRPIIERSLAWRSQTENDDLTETLTFVHEALKEALNE